MKKITFKILFSLFAFFLLFFGRNVFAALKDSQPSGSTNADTKTPQTMGLHYYYPTALFTPTSSYTAKRLVFYPSPNSEVYSNCNANGSVGIANNADQGGYIAFTSSSVHSDTDGACIYDNATGKSLTSSSQYNFTFNFTTANSYSYKGITTGSDLYGYNDYNAGSGIGSYVMGTLDVKNLRYYIYDDTSSTPPTCSDGIQNQDEIGVDSGGVCPNIYVSSDVTSLTTWDNTHTYVISGNVEIDPMITLTIDPGTLITFDAGASLTVNGTLEAIGDVSTSSVFNEIRFIESSGSGWEGIIVGSTGTANFDYATIRDAGTGMSGAQIFNDGGAVTMTNSKIVYGANYGIWNDSGYSNVASTDIGFNDTGAYLAGGTMDVTSNNIIHDNTSYGVYNATSYTIDAQYDYWGNATGPSGVGPGAGDAVTNYVDYSNWNGDPTYTSGTGSVDNYQIRLTGSTKYSTEFANAVATWNALSSFSINPVIIGPNVSPLLPNLAINDLYGRDDLSFAGQWVSTPSPDELQLNTYYLDKNISSSVQNVITHELGHALGLQHSYTGNIMYFIQSAQTTLGSQDNHDYYSLWP